MFEGQYLSIDLELSAGLYQIIGKLSLVEILISIIFFILPSQCSFLLVTILKLTYKHIQIWKLLTISMGQVVFKSSIVCDISLAVFANSICFVILKLSFVVISVNVNQSAISIDLVMFSKGLNISMIREKILSFSMNFIVFMDWTWNCWISFLRFLYYLIDTNHSPL